MKCIWTGIGVEVTNYSDALLSQCFGKGVLSKGVPSWRPDTIPLEANNSKSFQFPNTPNAENSSDFVEPLQLSLEEAFYLTLSNTIQIFEVMDDTKKEQYLNRDLLWRKCFSVQPNFAVTFCAYNHFRKQGWIPKCGLKFGVHFVLYPKGGPERCHSMFGILLQGIDHTGRIMEQAGQELTWNVVLRAVREILLCSVKFPGPALGEFCDTHEKAVVSEVVVRRWQENFNRES